jgi:CRISPR-associated protein Csd1
MMLRALVAYADRVGLGDLDFEPRPVDYELRLLEDGTFAGLVALGQGKERGRGERLPADPPSKNNPGFPTFVVDKAQYVLCVSKPNEKGGNAKKSFDSYVALLDEASRATNDAGLKGLYAFLAREDQVTEARAALVEREPKAEGRDGKVLVPAIATSGGWERVHERVAVASWWSARRASERARASEATPECCLVTGALGAVARTHGALKGPPFPGTGAKLVAFDKDAFASHGLDQGANAPVSEPAARKYVAALNAMLARDPQGRRESAVDVDDGVIVFWTRDESDAPAFVLDVLNPPRTARDAADAAASPWRGARPVFSPSPFYAVTLSANQARVVVRDWLETTADAVAANLARWFGDLQLGEDEAPVPLQPMLRALQAAPTAQGDKRGLPPNLAGRLFGAAVFGGPLPRELLAAAVARMRVPPPSRGESGDVLRFRAAVIKATLIRSYQKEISVALDETNTDRAYLLGRLFAALEKLQLIASGRGKDLNATIRDRYYGAASTTPASVFGRLLGLSMHHASKTRDDGLGIVAEKAKASIMTKLPAEGFPRTLRLAEQGLFAIGYYHQREAFFTSKRKPEEDRSEGDPQEGDPT